MQEDKHTHMPIGGDFNAQVGANDEPDATNDEREQNAIDSKYFGRHPRVTRNSRGQWLGHSAVQHHLVLANTFFQQQDYNEATCHSTKHCKQLDDVLMNRALFFKHCKDAESTGQIDMNSDHKAVIARTKLQIDHKNQQRTRSAKNENIPGTCPQHDQLQHGDQPSNTSRTQR